MTELYVTNFNRNFTGVSATAAGVLRQQVRQFDLALVGEALPGCPFPITRAEATRATRSRPPARPFAIWHVRRNTEMRAALWARDVLRCPIRIVFTSAAQRRHSAFPRWLIGRMDAVIATTEAAAGFVPNVRAVVPHGVDCEVFRPASDRRAAWAETGHPGTSGIATVGRIRPEKGTDLFVDAMLRALPGLPGVTALVIGKATRDHAGFETSLRTRIREAGLADRILFPGELAPEALAQLLPALSLVVNLPRYEGYGMVPLEAMASGTPFVASDTGHFRAFSGDGAAGVIVPREGAEAAAEHVTRLMSDARGHEAMARKARARAVAEHSTAREAGGIAEVYEALWRER